jgi:hypothetical protein
MLFTASDFDVNKIFFIILLNKLGANFSVEKRLLFWANFILRYHECEGFNFLELYREAEELERRNSINQFRHLDFLEIYSFFEYEEFSIAGYCQVVDFIQNSEDDRKKNV